MNSSMYIFIIHSFAASMNHHDYSIIQRELVQCLSSCHKQKPELATSEVHVTDRSVRTSQSASSTSLFTPASPASLRPPPCCSLSGIGCQSVQCAVGCVQDNATHSARSTRARAAWRRWREGGGGEWFWNSCPPLPKQTTPTMDYQLSQRVSVKVKANATLTQKCTRNPRGKA